MPVIKSAIKKLRQAKVKTEKNRAVKGGLKDLISKFRRTPKSEALVKLYSALDKAAKTNVIHKNKASRLKSRLAKLLTKVVPQTIVKPVAKKTSKKK